MHALPIPLCLIFQFQLLVVYHAVTRQVLAILLFDDLVLRIFFLFVGVGYLFAILVDLDILFDLFKEEARVAEQAAREKAFSTILLAADLLMIIV